MEARSALPHLPARRSSQPASQPAPEQSLPRRRPWLRPERGRGGMKIYCWIRSHRPLGRSHGMAWGVRPPEFSVRVSALDGWLSSYSPVLVLCSTLEVQYLRYQQRLGWGNAFVRVSEPHVARRYYRCPPPLPPGCLARPSWSSQPRDKRPAGAALPPPCRAPYEASPASRMYARRHDTVDPN